MYDSRRAEESMRRDTITLVTLRHAAVAMSGSRSITKPGLTPVMTITRPCVRAAVCIAFHMWRGGQASSSQVDTTS